MSALTVTTLRVLLVLLFLGTLCAQLWLIPQLALSAAQSFPELAWLVAPYTAVCIAIVGCAQLVLVAMWALLSTVRRGAIFAGQASGWVTAIIWAGIVATALTLGLQVHLHGFVQIGNPATVILLNGLALTGGTFTLLMVVMRGLLRNATALHSELEQVV